MSDTTASTARFWLIMAALFILVVIIVGGAGTDGPPYDPESVNPDGARGIVEVLEALGADVAIRQSTPRPDDTAVLMLQDRLTEDDRFALTQWVRAGGVLVAADGNSSFAPYPRDGVASRLTGPVTKDSCTIPIFDQAQRLELSESYRLDTNGHPFCFGDATDGAFIVAQPEGNGTIVSVGGQELFTNATLDEADAAVVATALLAPNPSNARITFLGPSITEGVVSGVTDLIAPRVVAAIFQLMAAFLLYALFRMRRLGAVVAEPLPVVIQGSELVLQTGVLSERAKDPASAADILRTDFTTRAHRYLGIPRDGGQGTDPAPILIEVIADQTGTTSTELVHALTSTVETDDDLVDVARQLGHIDDALAR